MSEDLNLPLKRWPGMVVLAWLIMIGFDFFLHAGILAPLYREPDPFLLPMDEAFRLIPLGYTSFLLLAVLLCWLMNRLRIQHGKAGFLFGLKLGLLTWGAFCMGLASISSAAPFLLLGWFLGQSLEMALGGLVIGIASSTERMGRLTGWVLLGVVILIALGIVIQNVMGA